MEAPKYRIFVINMARNVQRWSLISAQLEKFGLNYERVDGTDASKLSATELSKFYSPEKNRSQYPRRLTVGEIGCYISHVNCWNKIFTEGLDFGVVLEDDVILSDKFPSALKFLQQHFSEWNFTRLQTETKKRILYAEKVYETFSLREFIRTSGGTWGYAVNADTAKKLCRDCLPFGITVDSNMHFYGAHGIDVLALFPPVVFGAQFESEINRSQSRQSVRKFYPFARQVFQVKSYLGELCHLCKRDGLKRFAKRILTSKTAEIYPFQMADIRSARMDICYVTNESFVPYMAVSITSLLENNSSCNVAVHILHSDLSEATKAHLQMFERRYKNAKIIFHKIDDSRFEKFGLTIEHITKETYFRYMIADVLPDIDRVLYLDGDTIVNGDISELFDTDLTNYYCAGVSDIYIESVGYKKTLGIDGLYINAGVILFNLDEMRKTDIAEKLFKLTAENNFKYQDQDAINVAFNGKIKELECVYNFKRAHQKAFPEKTPSAKIIHFVGPNKPWRKFTFNRLKRLYFRYKNIFMETKKTYEEIVFKATPPKDDIMRILDKAWHLRDFEIELYWKRTIYFSTFAGALFVGYCSEIFKDAPSMKIVISFLGVVISWIWLLVNKGSKYWQENWENHINLLEEELGGRNLQSNTESVFQHIQPF